MLPENGPGFLLACGRNLSRFNSCHAMLSPGVTSHHALAKELSDFGRVPLGRDSSK
jgi:hypothetical protein